jgi:GR25 family glycosyltransferase involved in LPS biosynthesis
MDTAFQLITNKINADAKTKTVDNDLLQIWKLLLESVRDKITEFNPIKLNIPKKTCNILLTMTTCKRLSLFKQTVNSILNNWKDISLVDDWLVVDDNSTQEDRDVMTSTYPFISYHMRTSDDRGHLRSMNIIYEYLEKNNPTYWIHVEDDMLFFNRDNYITKGIQGLQELSYFNVKQIVFNRDYAETIDQVNMYGHVSYSNSDYALHDYKPQGQYCKYWPYFSFRPSIIDVETIIKLGNFDSPNNFFEMNYAYKFTQAGYRTAFFNSVNHLHIGRLTNTAGNNAYTLNNTPQFNGEVVPIKFDKSDYNIKVINLKKRTDRLELIKEQLVDEKLLYERFEAVDGSELVCTPEITKLFEGNDFNYKCGVVGCALSHYYLWKELITSDCSYYIIMEDDVKLCKDFKNKLNEILPQIHVKDILFFGYLMFKNNQNKYSSIYDVESDKTEIEPLKKELYIGGTHCYSITKAGASGLIDYIDMYGIKHGIDYLMAKVQSSVSVYETIPHLAFAEWHDTPNKIVDSDIQYDTKPIKICLNDDVKKESVDIVQPQKDDVQEYIFVQGFDQINYDMYHVSNVDVKALQDIADIIPCVAFNSLGFFKEQLTELTPSNYFKETDGIYVKKEYYFDVYKKKE